MKPNTPLLLTDEQMRTFITEGFLILNTDFPEAFHQRLVQELQEVYDKEGNPGNNLLPRIRELQTVFEHPVITGALTSILGEDYMLHAHRHGHYNASPVPGGWHKDSYWGYDRMRNHHPWWAMIMYFPQDTPIELGPTGVMPGTQNYETRTFVQDEVEGEQLASGKAGTFALIHYDIWHRSTANILGAPRFMLKFEFMRTKAPAAPTWNNQDPAWRLPETMNPAVIRQDLMWEETWNWLCGKQGSLAATLADDEVRIAELVRQLTTDNEPLALSAAYELGCRGNGGLQALLEALHHEQPAVSRAAAYGLTVCGKQALNGLTAALRQERPQTLCGALFALGEARGDAASAVPAMQELLHHASAEVRCAVVEALGMIAAPADQVVSALVQGLRDLDTQVRFTSGLALIRMGPSAEPAIPALLEALHDDNRYVQAHAAEALRYIGTEEAKDYLIRELFNTRWCSATTPASTF